MSLSDLVPIKVPVSLLTEPAPAATIEHRPSAEIPQELRTGAVPFYVVVVSDDSAGKGGVPITWETQIPEGSTLQSALRHRARVGNRYGTTFIAECRIIPELTIEALPND